MAALPGASLINGCARYCGFAGAALRYPSQVTVHTAIVITYVQDYLYVQSFIRLIGATLAKAPTADIGPLANGITIVNGEMDWFRGKAKERQIDLENKGTH